MPICFDTVSALNRRADRQKELW